MVVGPEEQQQRDVVEHEVHHLLCIALHSHWNTRQGNSASNKGIAQTNKADSDYKLTVRQNLMLEVLWHEQVIYIILANEPHGHVLKFTTLVSCD